MKFTSADIGKSYSIENILEGVPCMNCNPCMRLRIMELGLTPGEKILIKDHKMGIWLIDVLSENGNTTYSLALRDEEAERVCLLD
jgi:Fe2+ transport system protein FeoA